MWTLLWGHVLLGALLLSMGATVRPAMAAPLRTVPAQAPTIAFAKANYLFDEGQGTGEIVLRVEPTSDTPITVTVSSANIQAEASKDFEGLRQSLVISPTESTYTLSVTLLDDSLVEGDEQLRVTLSNYQGVVPGVITETLVTIEDNDSVSLSMNDVEVEENAGSVTLVLTQSAISTLDSVVDIRTVDGSATAPDDYQAAFMTAMIPAGSVSTTVTIQLTVDEVPEVTESFSLLLQEPTNAAIGDDTALVTILDDDAFPELSFTPVEANETDGSLPFVVTLSTTSVQTVTVDYRTMDGSAIAPADYLSQSGTLLFAPGSISATVEIMLVQDQLDEPDENFFLVFTNPVHAILDSIEVEGTIISPLNFNSRVYLPGLKR